MASGDASVGPESSLTAPAIADAASAPKATPGSHRSRTAPSTSADAPLSVVLKVIPPSPVAESRARQQALT